MARRRAHKSSVLSHPARPHAFLRGVGGERTEGHGERGARWPVDGHGDGAGLVARDEAANDTEHREPAVLQLAQALRCMQATDNTVQGLGFLP